MKRKTFGLGWVMNVEITEQGFGFAHASVAIAVTMAAFASPWCDAWWPEENPPGARSCPLMVHLSRHYVLLASTSPSALEFILPFILFLFLFFPLIFLFFPFTFDSNFSFWSLHIVSVNTITAAPLCFKESRCWQAMNKMKEMKQTWGVI